MTSIRLMLIIPTLDQGGAEKQLVELATGLPRPEFEVTVCTLTRSGPWADKLQQHAIPLINLGKRWKLDPAAYFRLRKVLRRHRPDIVHTWLFAANAYGRQAARSEGVVHIVGGERCVDRWKSWHQLAIDRYLARRTSCLVTNSQGVVEFYAGHGVPRAKFEVIPNGIATASDLSEPVTVRDQLLAELGLPADARLIGAIGRLWPQKRYKDLIWAAELLRFVDPRAHLLVIGDGPQRAALREFRDVLGLKQYVHFLGHRPDVSRFLPHLDCFWLASGYEGQSNSLMEAMLAGVPVVVSDIPGNRDLVEADVSGVLVPVGDRAGFARQTQWLFSHPDEARRIAVAARERMRHEFSLTNMVERHADLYRRLVSGERAGG